MSITLFFVDAFTSALDRGMASPADILRHVTPEVLSIHLPRNLWARLLTACLGAPRVDATTIIETVGIPNLCEHMPKPLLWTCLADLAATALGGARAPQVAATMAASMQPATATATSAPTSAPMTATPAAAPSAAASGSASGVYGASAAAAGMATTIGLATSPSAPSVSGAPSGARAMRASSPDMLLPPPPASTRPPTGPIDAVLPEPNEAGRRATAARGLGTSRMSAGASSRRPQAGVAPVGPGPVLPTPRSAVTPTSMPAQTPRRDELDFEIETDLRADWKTGSKDAIPVDDEQLVDWSASEETSTGSSIDRNKR